MGSAESMDYDQVLDSVLVGPVPGGRHMFVFQVRKNGLGLVGIWKVFHIYIYREREVDWKVTPFENSYWSNYYLYFKIGSYLSITVYVLFQVKAILSFF